MIKIDLTSRDLEMLQSKQAMLLADGWQESKKMMSLYLNNPDGSMIKSWNFKENSDEDKARGAGETLITNCYNCE